MKDKENKYRRAFIPSNPQDKHRSQIEIMNWQAELEAEKKRERRETRRFIITRFCRKSCVKADKRSSRKQEQIKGLPVQGSAQLNRAYHPVFRDEGRYACAA